MTPRCRETDESKMEIAVTIVHPRLITMLATIALLALAGCTGPAVPPDVFYRIEPAAAMRLAKPVCPACWRSSV